MERRAILKTIGASTAAAASVTGVGSADDCDTYVCCENCPRHCDECPRCNRCLE